MRPQRLLKQRHQRLYQVRQLLNVAHRGVGYPRTGLSAFHSGFLPCFILRCPASIHSVLLNRSAIEANTSFSPPPHPSWNVSPAKVQHLHVPWDRRARCGGFWPVPGQHIPGEQHHRRCVEHQTHGCRRHTVHQQYLPGCDDDPFQ